MSSYRHISTRLINKLGFHGRISVVLINLYSSTVQGLSVWVIVQYKACYKVSNNTVLAYNWFYRQISMELVGLGNSIMLTIGLGV